VSDPKTERLLNLTMALLATKRLLTKGEIFSTVAGYAGAMESMERMFERDKDDLRSLGIEIEVAPLDSLFEDELGYRITPDSYALKIPDITPSELGVLSIAAKSWRNSLFSESAQKALVKVASLGLEPDVDSLHTSIIPLDENSADFETLWMATFENRELDFEYSESSDTRRIQPYGISLYKGEWFLVGFDIDKDDIRTFKVKRIRTLKMAGKKNAFTPPVDFDLKSAIILRKSESRYNVVLKVRANKALSIRSGSTISRLDDDWDRIETSYSYRGEALSEILWHAPDVVVEEPKDLRASVIAIWESRLNPGVSNGK
jgi:proteasome accessory factor B